MSKPLIVLTGASGRLGATVHRTFLDAGQNVRATDRKGTSSQASPVITADLLRPAACRRILREANVLVHLAYDRELEGHSNGYPCRTFEDHILLNRRVFQAACEAGVKKIIFSSSVQVIAPQFPSYGASPLPHSLPLDENSPPQPDNWYSLAKRCSEEMLAMLRRKYEIDYVVLRFPTLAHTVPILQPEEHQGRWSEGLSYLSIRDAANLLLKVVESDLPGGRTYFPASRNNSEGLPPEKVIRDFYPGVPLRRPAGDLEGLIDLSTLKRDFDWEPQDLSQPEGIATFPLTRRVRRWLLSPVQKSLKYFVKPIFQSETQ
jgi:nucleoside-diphosphate-sugar epimerase